MHPPHSPPPPESTFVANLVEMDSYQFYHSGHGVVLWGMIQNHFSCILFFSTVRNLPGMYRIQKI